jgi:hypothetical protein
MNFQKITVRTVYLDNLDEYLNDKLAPRLLKIDVEGGEYLVLSGAKKLLSTVKPLVLVEVHSIYNMYRLREIFDEVKYKMELIKEEDDGRCFFACRPVY